MMIMSYDEYNDYYIVLWFVYGSELIVLYLYIYNFESIFFFIESVFIIKNTNITILKNVWINPWNNIF